MRTLSTFYQTVFQITMLVLVHQTLLFSSSTTTTKFQSTQPFDQATRSPSRPPTLLQSVLLSMVFQFTIHTMEPAVMPVCTNFTLWTCVTLIQMALAVCIITTSGRIVFLHALVRPRLSVLLWTVFQSRDPESTPRLVYNGVNPTWIPVADVLMRMASTLTTQLLTFPTFSNATPVRL